MKNITFITTGQPTTNPRLVKEAETLVALGYNVKVICCFYQHWAQHFDNEIILKNPGMYLYCGGSPANHKLTWYKTRFRQKLCNLLFRWMKGSVAENAISRTHSEALQLAKKIRTDLYIAHNLGALPAAVQAAKANRAKVGYDAEDMHSGQFKDHLSNEYLLNKLIEERYFPLTDYFTAASPLIAENYRQIYPFLNPIILNNVFLRNHLPFNKQPSPGVPLKLFWFSQTVGTDRGIETVIAAMGAARINAELHLLGSCSNEYQVVLNQLVQNAGLNANQIHLYPPVASSQLFAFAMQFDIGLASETGDDLNRDICLTNKIFTYLQCGLAILASNTQAQTLFLQQYPQSGKLYEKHDVSSLATCLQAYANSRELLAYTQNLNYQLGQKQMNWEAESKCFINLIEKTLAP